MKYCSHCGNELLDEAVICPKCGCSVVTENKSSSSNATLINVAKGFMILSCALYGVLGLFYGLAINAIFLIFLLPVAWCIPMTIVLFNKVSKGEEISIAFKICTLVFVSTISGILLLCHNEN